MTKTLNLSGGVLSVSTTFIASNTFTLSGGTLQKAVLIATNGGSVVVNSGTFDGVTVNGMLDVGNTVSGALLTVTNGLTLNGMVLVGNPTNANYGRIDFAGTQSLSGTGAVVFGDEYYIYPYYGYYWYNALRESVGGNTLTIGSGITIRGQNGTIGYSSNTGGPNNISVVNQGTIQADIAGGIITINAQPFVNQGSMIGYGGTFNVDSVLDNRNGSITAAGTNQWTLNGGGSIWGGTVNATNGGSVVVNSGTFDGVTVNGMLDVGNTVSGALLTVTNGLTLNGMVLVGNPTNANYGRIDFAGTQSLSGTGAVVFGDEYYIYPYYGYYWYNALRESVGGNTLTIGSGITIRGQNGTIGYSSNTGGPNNISVVNQGTIQADIAGGIITINAQPFVNQGSMIGYGGTFNVDSVLDNRNGSITAAGTNQWTLNGGGSIWGGTVNATNGGSVVVNSGTFDGVTVNGMLDVGNTVSGALLTVTNGLTLNGMVLVGNPTNANYGRIDFAGTQSLSGTGAVVFGDEYYIYPYYGYYWYNALRESVGGNTLTIGSGITIRGQNGTIGYSSNTGGPNNISVVNQGTIQADIAGGIITINAQPFVNHGTVTQTLGSLSVVGTVDLTGQAVLLDTNSWLIKSLSSVATVRGGQIIATNGTSLVVNSQLTLDGVSFKGNIDVGNTVNGSTLTLTNGLTLNGTMSIGNTNNGWYGRVNLAGSQSIAGNATIVFGNASSCYNYLGLSYPNTSMTLGSGVVVRGQNGTVGYTSCSGGLTNNWIFNQGSIQADVAGGTFYLNALGSFTNTGSIIVNSNCNIYLGITFNATNLGTFSCSNGGVVNLSGVFQNTNNNFSPTNYGGLWVLNSGTIQGGSIQSSNSSTFYVSSGMLDGVTFNGLLDVGNTYNTAGLVVTNGLTLNGTAMIGNPSNSQYGAIAFAGSQTLGGNATVIFGNEDYTGYGYPGRNALWLSVAGTTLNIGSNAIVRGQYGTIGVYSSYPYYGPSNVGLLNQGTISDDIAIGVLRLSPLGGLTNQGSINIAANCEVDLGGSFTASNLGTLTCSSNGVVNLIGTLINTGNVFNLASYGGIWVLNGGGVQGGTINIPAGGALFVGNSGGFFDGVTVSGLLDVGNTYSGSKLTVTNGLTLNGTALIGNPNNSSYGDIAFNGSQMLGGNGTVIFGNDSYNGYTGFVGRNALSIPLTGTTLTIGGGITLYGKSGTIGYSPLWGGSPTVNLANSGTLYSTNAGQITISASLFNIGSIYVTNSSFALGGTNNLANLGNLYVTNSQFYLTGIYLNTNNILWINGLGGKWILQNGGSIVGGTVIATNGASLAASSGTLDGVTMNGLLDVGNTVYDGSLTVTNGLVLNGTALIGNSGGNYGQIYFGGSQGFGGSANVVFGNSSSDAFVLSLSGTALTLSNSVTLHGQSGTIGWSGSSPNVTLLNQGNIAADVTGGTLSINAGPFVNQGSLGAPYGTLYFAGTSNNFTANNIGVGISGPGTNGSLAFAGIAPLPAIALNVSLNNGYIPALSNTYSMITYGALGGYLGNLALPGGNPQWQGNYGPTSFILTTTNSVASEVNLIAPGNYALFRDPTNVFLMALATNNYYAVTEVDFLHEGTLIGVSTNSPYAFTWTNPPGGVYSLTALAKDANGVTAVSTPVSITVLPQVTGTNYVWTGSVSSDWNNQGNWSPMGIPGAQDSATINGGGVTLTSNVNIYSVFLNGGSLNGSSNLFVENTFDWASGSISCPVTIMTNAAMNWIGTGNSTLYSLFSPLTNFGTLNWYRGGNMTVYNYPGSYYGGIINQSGGCFNVYCDQTINNVYGYEYFINAGTFTKFQSNGITRLYTIFTNTGTLSAQDGTIYVYGYGSGLIGGNLVAATNATINFAAGSFVLTNNPTFQGAGQIVDSGGSLALGGGYTGVLNYSSGNLAGTITGTLNWSGGQIPNGNSLTVAGNGVLNINGSVNLYGSLTNYGTVNWQSGSVALWGSAYGYNSGPVVNALGGLWNIQCDQAIYLVNGYPCANGYFVNAGTLTKSGTTGTASISILATNTGAVVSQSGTINFNGGGDLNGSAQASAGAYVYFSGGNFDLHNFVSAGAGVVSFNGANIYGTLGGTLNWSGGGIVSGSSLTILSNSVLNINGSVNLYGSLTNYGTVNWQSGSVALWGSAYGYNSGPVVNALGGLWNIQCDQAIYLVNGYPCANGYFVNAGTLTKSGTTGTASISILATNTGAVVSQSGTINFNGGGDLNGSAQASAGAYVYFSGGNFDLHNFVSAGAGVVSFNGANIYGTLGGTLNWSGGGIVSGSSLTILSNSVLNINGSVNLYGSLTNYGTVNWQSGSVALWGSAYGYNSGPVVNALGGLWNIQCDQAIYLVNGYPCANGYFVNAGTLTKSGTTGTASISIPSTNTGTAIALTGTVSFNNGYVQTGANLDFGLSSSNSSGQITIPGNLNLDGTLGINLLNGYLPVSGDTFTLMNYGSRSGTFNSLGLPPLISGLAWQVFYNPTTFGIKVVGSSSFIYSIVGTVKDSLGHSLANVNVFSYQTNSSNNLYVSANTDSNGNYSINVTNGTWSVGAQGLPNLGFNNPTVQSIIVNGTNVTVNFVVTPFSGQTYNLTTSANPPAAGTALGGGTFYSGTLQSVTATATNSVAPYYFTSWSENSVQQSTSNVYSFTLSRDRNLIANFALPIYSVLASNNPTAAGSITGAGSYVWGTTNTLIATPGFGYAFSNWTEGATTVGTNRSLTFVVLTNRSFSANYAETNLAHIITTAASPSGIASVAGSGTFTNGQTANLSAPLIVTNGPTRYTFQQFTLNGSYVSSSNGFAKTFSTLDVTNISVVAIYSSQNIAPLVQSVSDNYGTLVPATTNFVITTRFDRTMSTNIIPSIVITNTLPGSTQASVPTNGGYWTSYYLLNDTFVAPPVTFVQGMDGTNQVIISQAQDLLGATLTKTNVLSFVIDATFPVISNVLVTPGSTTAVVGWSTSELSTSQVEYGLTGSYGFATSFNSQLLIPHVATISGLTSLNTYHYRIHSKDTAGNETITPDNTFFTPAIPPTLAFVSPNFGYTNGGASVVVTGTGFEIGATVSFGSQASSSVVVNSTSSLTAVVPPSVLGTVNLTVSNPDGGSATLTNAFIYTYPPPVIVSQPVSQTGIAGSNVVFQVAATGHGLISYQWQYNGANLADNAYVNGSHSNVLTLSNVFAAEAGNFQVVVSSPYGSTGSAVVSLSVLMAPSINTQPQNQSIGVGGIASFSVVASGTSPLGYQWRYNSVAISGATSSTYTINNVQLANQGQYSVVVSNAAGAATSTAANLSVLSYCATASVSQSFYPMNTPVPLQVRTLVCNSNMTVANSAATVWITTTGTSRSLPATTDGSGYATVNFVPLPSETGAYQIAASLPGQTIPSAQGAFNIVGLNVDPSSIGAAIIVGNSQTNIVALSNLTSVAISGITASAVGKPANVSVQVSAPSSLGGFATNQAVVVIHATGSTPSQSQFNIRFTSAEGVTNNLPVSLSVITPVPQIGATPTSLTASMLDGQQTLVSFDLVNTGGADSGAVSVLLPSAPWLSLVTASPIPSIAPGATNHVTLALTPALDLPLGVYSGSLVVSRTNGINFNVPFQFTDVSQLQGSLLLIVQDELSIYGAGNPNVSNATVTLSDHFSGTPLLTNVTDSSGLLFYSNLISAYYDVAVTAPNHSGFTRTILLSPSITNSLTAFLPLQLVDYTWQVTPTTVVDQYTFTLNTTFQTEVPWPVVTIDPSSLNLCQYSYLPLGGAVSTNLTISNHGLISAQGLQLVILSNANWDIEPLGGGNLGDLAANASITVPVVIRHLDTNTSVDSSISAGVNWYVTTPTQTRYYVTPLFVYNANPNDCMSGGSVPIIPPVLPTPPVGTNSGISVAVNSGVSSYSGGDVSGGGGQTGSSPTTPYVPSTSYTSPSTNFDGVVVSVAIQIDQSAVITRNAFKATLILKNKAGLSITNLSVAISPEDATGQPATNQFFIQPAMVMGIGAVDGTGFLANGSSGQASWTIIPTTNAAPTGSTKYAIGGTLAYVLNGRQVIIPLFPHPITVLPDPKFDVDYFLEHDVYSDDPFTVPIEPTVPVGLGLIVRNNGLGIANNFTITSAQPVITTNANGLAVAFQLISSQVGSQNQTPSLTLNMGDIAPSNAAVGLWYLTSSLEGAFVDYSATFHHVDALGGTNTSLVNSVKIHEMNHVVRIASPFDDGIPDFLVNDSTNVDALPNNVYSSDGSVLPVTSITNAIIIGVPTSQNSNVTVSANMPAGWVYLKLSDPSTGGLTILNVRRSDGVNLFVGPNVWQTPRRDHLLPPKPQNLVHIFDFNSTGSYVITYGSTNQIPAPVINPVSPRTIAVGSKLTITNQAFSARSPVHFSLAPSSPFGSSISTNGVFSWTPQCLQGSTTNSITVWVADSGTPALSNSVTFQVTVSECVQVSIGSTVVQTGQTTCVPVSLITTVNLTNLSFTLVSGTNRFTNWGISSTNPSVGFASVIGSSSTQAQFALNALNGQVLSGPTTAGQICLTALPGHSAFLPLQITAIGGTRADGVPIGNVFGNSGRVVVIGAEPLLEAGFSANASRSIILYGNPGEPFHIQCSTNLNSSANWTEFTGGGLTNLQTTFSGLSTDQSQIFYRAYQVSTNMP